MKRVGLGLIVALAGVGCDPFGADAPRVTPVTLSDAGADHEAPPLVTGEPTPDDCKNGQIDFDFERPTPEGITLTGAPETRTEASPHTTYVHLASGAPENALLVSGAAGHELCLRFAYRVTSTYDPKPGDRPSWQFFRGGFRASLSVGVGLAGTLSKDGLVYRVHNLGTSNDLGVDVAPGAHIAPGWHVLALLAKASTGKVAVTTSFDGVVVDNHSFEAAQIPDSLSVDATLGNSGGTLEGAGVDIDDIRVRAR